MVTAHSSEQAPERAAAGGILDRALAAGQPSAPAFGSETARSAVTGSAAVS
jgi:hypothetical protein